jgi:periplasmic copper chaperone A
MFKKTTFIIGLVAAFATTAHAEIRVTQPYAQVVRDNAPVASAYMTLHNTGSQDDELIGVSSTAAGHVELHNTTVDDNGVARMSSIPGIGVAAGETVSLEPGEKHIMLMQISEPISEGDEIYLTLKFAQSPDQTIKFTVQNAGKKRSEVQMNIDASDYKKTLGYDGSE